MMKRPVRLHLAGEFENMMTTAATRWSQRSSAESITQLVAERACDDEDVGTVGEGWLSMRPSSASSEPSPGDYGISLGTHLGNRPRPATTLRRPSKPRSYSSLTAGSTYAVRAGVGALLITLLVWSLPLHHAFELCPSPL